LGGEGKILGFRAREVLRDGGKRVSGGRGFGKGAVGSTRGKKWDF